MYEKKHHPLAPFRVFIKRILRNLAVACVVIVASLGVGILGYSYFEKLNFVDAYESAAMILSGMGPFHEMSTVGGKIFAGTYALFSGVIFLIVIAIIMAPVFHRFFHAFLIKEPK